MEYLHINGGRPLCGSVRLQGAKNSALPVLAAALMANCVSVIGNCPALSDVEATAAILESLGCVTERSGSRLTVDSRGAYGCSVSDGLMRRLRSSIIFMGAITARFGRAELSGPGGCELGPRPIDIHVCALTSLGARISEHGGSITCTASAPKGRELILPIPSVGATENIMLFATSCAGTTTLINAAREPEICDLQSYLVSAGYSVSGAGTPVITVEGGRRLAPELVTFEVMPDRIAAATYLCGAAATGGEVEVLGAKPEHLGAVLKPLSEAGCSVSAKPDSIRLARRGRLDAPAEMLRTGPYPCFPTDAQALIAAPLCLARGRTVIEETVFEDRFRHIPELTKLGADARSCGRYAVITGTERLHGAVVSACDLRGAAGLLIACAAADGESILRSPHYLLRGYEQPVLTLRSLGADITEVKEQS